MGVVWSIPVDDIVFCLVSLNCCLLRLARLLVIMVAAFRYDSLLLMGGFQVGCHNVLLMAVASSLE